jgi:hypothetical protein
MSSMPIKVRLNFGPPDTTTIQESCKNDYVDKASRLENGEGGR